MPGYGRASNAIRRPTAVLREEARHHHVAVILHPRVLAIATIQLLGHPLRERALLRLDGCQFLAVPGHLVREGVCELRCRDLTAFDPLGDETKRGGLQRGSRGDTRKS